MEDVTIRFGSDSHQSNDVRGAQYSVSLVWREKKKKRKRKEKEKEKRNRGNRGKRERKKQRSRRSNKEHQKV